MALTALIRFTQGILTGDPGEALVGVKGVVVSCEWTGTGTPTTFTWSKRDVPQGELSDETSALATGTFGGNANPVTFTPDVHGSYSIALTVSDGATTVSTTCDFIVPDEFGVKKPSYKAVAAFVKYLVTGLPQLRGWATMLEGLFSLVRKLALIVHRRQELYYGVSGDREVHLTLPTDIGAIRFDPSVLPAAGAGGVARTIRFEAELEATPGMTAEVRLYNLTDAAVVANTTLVSSATSMEFKTSIALTVPGMLPNAAKDYVVQLRISAGSPAPTDKVICKMARLNVGWV